MPTRASSSASASKGASSIRRSASSSSPRQDPSEHTELPSATGGVVNSGAARSGGDQRRVTKNPRSVEVGTGASRAVRGEAGPSKKAEPAAERGGEFKSATATAKRLPKLDSTGSGQAGAASASVRHHRAAARLRPPLLAAHRATA